MRKSLSLAVYLLWARLRGALKRRPVALNAPDRPRGTLVWLHLGAPLDSPPVIDVLRRLKGEIPDLRCLVTTSGGSLPQAICARLPEGTTLTTLPRETPADCDAFLDRWQPDLVLWPDFTLRPALLDRTKRRGIPMVLINARLSVMAFRRWRFLRGMVGSLLGRFDRVLVQNTPSAGYFRALGVPKERVLVTGQLSEGSIPLPHNESERRRLAATIGGRAVWLAAGLHLAELGPVLAAHRQARRSFPELLLIILPDDPATTDAMVRTCRDGAYKVTKHSDNEGISRRTDIVIIDKTAESGLWFRLAPVAFLGGSLVPAGGLNPYGAAAAGSAIMHGPHIENYTAPYNKLTAAGACVEIAGETELAEALEQTLVPERAAEMATAAWRVGSEGAEVTDMVLDVLQSCLNRGKS